LFFIFLNLKNKTTIYYRGYLTMAKSYDEILQEYRNRKSHFSVYLTRSGKPEAYARERKGRGGFYNPKGPLMLEHRKDLLKSITKQERDRLKEIISSDKRDYELLGEYADMQDVLESTVIQGRPFKEIIMDDNIELVGQD
jgi:hypothetical protein